ATGDYADGGAGVDTVWGDANADTYYAEGRRNVSSFANGADPTPDGDRSADPGIPTLGYTTPLSPTMSRMSLFSSAGPTLGDIRQGQVGDCWLMAELGAMANDDPQSIRQRVVDFGDGTYGVAIGGNFYRVDNDLPVYSEMSIPTFAGLGA